ncbi:alpha/beta fold hydrolase [Thermodesulfobacteriota bacterium]
MTSPFQFFKTHDNLSIRYGVWPCRPGKKSGSIVLLGGRREFLEKYFETIVELNQRRFDVYGLDWRGQGLSTRLLPNQHKGYVQSYEDYINDLSLFVINVIQPRAVAPISILAHSMGGHIALRFLHDHPGLVHRVILVAPMIDILTHSFPRWLVKIFTRLAVATGLATAYVVGSRDYNAADHNFNGNRLTSDPERFMDEKKAIAANPELALGDVTYGWFRATLTSIDILNQPGYTDSIETPIQIISAGSDGVVSIEAQKALCDKLPNCRMKIIPGARHEILKETDSIRSAFWDVFDNFIKASR